MMNKTILTALAIAMSSLMATAQTLEVDFSKPQTTFNGTQGYDFGTKALSKKNLEQMSYSFKVPDGNWRVTVTLGSDSYAGNTTVRAESRRLLAENVQTKKKESKVMSWTIHKRSPYINENDSVHRKPREKDYVNWDGRLTLTFNGPAPAVRSIKVEPDNEATTLFLCGNSTVVDQEYEPWCSWGQMLTRWFGPKVCVANYAESGERTSSFMASKRLDKALSMAKEGDYFFVEFGHNDEKDRGAGCGAWYNFAHNLKTFIDRIQAKGCHVILVTPTARRAFEKGALKDTHGEYAVVTRTVAEREKVGLIDLTKMSSTMYETYGAEECKHFLVHYPAGTFEGQDKDFADNTHFNPFGAYELSKCIVMGLKKLNVPFINELRPDWVDFDPAKPDDWKAFSVPMTKTFEIAKPDGN